MLCHYFFLGLNIKYLIVQALSIDGVARTAAVLFGTAVLNMKKQQANPSRKQASAMQNKALDINHVSSHHHLPACATDRWA
jgi:hypothetical protein